MFGRLNASSKASSNRGRWVSLVEAENTISGSMKCGSRLPGGVLGLAACPVDEVGHIMGARDHLRVQNFVDIVVFLAGFVIIHRSSAFGGVVGCCA